MKKQVWHSWTDTTYDKKGKIVDSVRHSEIIEKDLPPEWMQKLFDELEEMAASPWTWNLVESLFVIFGPVRGAKEFKFLQNHFFPVVSKPEIFNYQFLALVVWFLLPAINKKETFLDLLRYIQECDPCWNEIFWFILGRSETKTDKAEFDSSLLDFLEGKITSAKMIEWGVGQVMKAFPKKFNPKDVKEAIQKRWSNHV